MRLLNYLYYLEQEGLVEIREEYIEDSQENISGINCFHLSLSLWFYAHSNLRLLGSSSFGRDEDVEREKDEEYKRVMARLDELEKEEQEAGSDGEEDPNDDEDEVEQPSVSDAEGGFLIPAYW